MDLHIFDEFHGALDNGHLYTFGFCPSDDVVSKALERLFFGVAGFTIADAVLFNRDALIVWVSLRQYDYVLSIVRFQEPVLSTRS